MSAKVDVSAPMGKLMWTGTFGDQGIANASQGPQGFPIGELDDEEYARV